MKFDFNKLVSCANMDNLHKRIEKLEEVFGVICYGINEKPTNTFDAPKTILECRLSCDYLSLEEEGKELFKVYRELKQLIGQIGSVEIKLNSVSDRNVIGNGDGLHEAHRTNTILITI